MIRLRNPIILEDVCVIDYFCFKFLFLIFPSFRLVIDKAGLESVDPKSTDYLMGLFSDTEMSFHGTRFSVNEPSLEDMTEKVFWNF